MGVGHGEGDGERMERGASWRHAEKGRRRNCAVKTWAGGGDVIFGRGTELIMQSRVLCQVQQ